VVSPLFISAMLNIYGNDDNVNETLQLNENEANSDGKELNKHQLMN